MEAARLARNEAAFPHRINSPRPKPEVGTPPPPHPEDFAVWCENPVTRFVARAFLAAAEAQKAAWTESSWGAGKLDPIDHAALRARADAYMAFLETPLERYIELTAK